jgi:DeoR/GlpR family transcriptional regulator of sugar metabolism
MKSSRLEVIEKIVLEKGKIRTEELSEFFDVSEVTIRSDLGKLAKKNKNIEKVYGGAVLRDQDMILGNEKVIMTKMEIDIIVKNIAKRAFEEIGEHDVIFLGSGTTCCYLAELLVNKPEVSVVTNNISALTQLISNGNKIYFIGGEVSTVDGNTYFSSIEDPLKYIQSIYVNKVFTSCRGMDMGAGITVNSIISTYIYKVIQKIQGKWYMMIKGEKFGKIGMYHVAEVEKLEYIITDYIDNEYLQYCEEKNVEVIMA